MSKFIKSIWFPILLFLLMELLFVLYAGLNLPQCISCQPGQQCSCGDLNSELITPLLIGIIPSAIISIIVYFLIKKFFK